MAAQRARFDAKGDSPRKTGLDDMYKPKLDDDEGDMFS